VSRKHCDQQELLRGSLQYLKGIRTATKVALLRCPPVEHVPDILHIGCFTVEILEQDVSNRQSKQALKTTPNEAFYHTDLEIVRVLPDINPKDRNLSLADNRILILRRHDHKPVLFATINFN